MTSDNTSLQNLNDIVVPPEVALWPLAPGWYVLAGILVLGLVWQAWRYWRQWKKNRYRATALITLSEVRAKRDRDALSQIPELLKRTALSGWPRRQVAALSGIQWHQFLDRTAATDRFGAGAGSILDRLAYAGGEDLAGNDAEIDVVLEAAEFWLKHHNADAVAE